MRIKVKIKHLVYSLSAAGLLIYLLTAIVLPRAALSGALERYAAGESKSKAQILEAIRNPISASSRWKLIREYVIEGGIEEPMKRFDVYIGPGTSMVSGDESDRAMAFSWPEKLGILQEYIAEAPIDGYAYRAAKQLAAYYSGAGQLDEAVGVLQEVEDRFVGTGNRWFRHDSMLRQARLLLDHGQEAEAARKLGQLESDVDRTDFDMVGRIALMQSELLVRRGEVGEAVVTVEQALGDYRQQWIAHKEKYGIGESVAETSAQLESRLAQLKRADAHDDDQTAEVSGVVRRSDGTPIPHAGVFLRHESVVNHSVIASEPYQMMTDEQGRYQFSGVIPGSYQLYLGLDFEQISGYTWPVVNDEWLDINRGGVLRQDIVLHPLLELKNPVNEAVIEAPDFEFEWQTVAGAAYYNVNIGLQIENGSVGSLFRANVPDNRLSVHAAQLYDKTAGISYQEVDGRSVADPLTLLAFANPDNRFYWSVEAYDRDGRMITRSNGYRLSDDVIGNLPFFYLQERVLTAADRLLLDGRQEEALAAYKRDYDEHPGDIHSLRMIIRLLPAEDDRLTYLLRMVELNPNSDYAFTLADEYYKQGNWQAFLDTVVGYDLAGPHDSYLQSIRGTALLKTGRHREAIAIFEQVMEIDPSHRFVGHYIAAVVHEEQGLDAAMEIAGRYPDRFMTGNGQDWLLLLRQAQAEAERSGQPLDYMRALKQAIGLFFQGENEQLEQWIGATKQESAKALIRAIIAVY